MYQFLIGWQKSSGFCRYLIEVIPLFDLVKCINLNYTSSQNDDDDDDGGA
jgi:hypothetical protein